MYYEQASELGEKKQTEEQPADASPQQPQAEISALKAEIADLKAILKQLVQQNSGPAAQEREDGTPEATAKQQEERPVEAQKTAQAQSEAQPPAVVEPAVAIPRPAKDASAESVTWEDGAVATGNLILGRTTKE